MQKLVAPRAETQSSREVKDKCTYFVTELAWKAAILLPFKLFSAKHSPTQGDYLDRHRLPWPKLS